MKRASVPTPEPPWEALLDRLLEEAGAHGAESDLLALAARLLAGEAPTAGVVLRSALAETSVREGQAELRVERPVALAMVVPEAWGSGGVRFLRTLSGLVGVARAASGAGAVGAPPVSESRGLMGAAALSQLIEAVNGIVWEAPLGAGGWSYASAGAARILGYPAESWARPAFWRQIVHPEDRGRVAEQSGAARGDRELEYRLRAADGRVLWFHDVVRLVTDSRGVVTGQRGVMLDITSRVEAEQARTRAHAELLDVQKVESLGLMAGGIAHDFNNLLTIILGNASLAAMRLPEHSPARGCIDDLIANGQRASELTRQLLAYAGRSQLMVEPVPVSGTLRELRSLLTAAVPRGSRLDLELDAHALLVDGDLNQLQQVFVNLVSNGGEALRERGGTVRVVTSTENLGGARAEALRLPPGDYVLVRVIDDGSGMDEATRRRIFDPFFTTRRSGHGLGLAVVHGVVKAHRGAIEVDSELGAGTTVRVYLPASVSTRPKHKAPSARIVTGTGLVLVVDDETEVRATARAMLEALGYDVIEAEDGRAGLVLFDRHRDTLRAVLLDMTMPVMSGEEVLGELRRRSASIRVVLSTGFSRVEARRGGAFDPLTGFLQKPYTVRQLGEVMARATSEEPEAL